MRNKGKVHRIIADLAEDPKVLEALDELTDSPTERQRAAADPAGWLKEKKIKIPPGAKVFFIPDNFSIGFELSIGDTTFSIGYNETDGAYATKD